MHGEGSRPNPIAFARRFSDDARTISTMNDALRPDPTVLVVDDEESIHALFAQLLKLAGFLALHARTVDQAKACLRDARVDAVILDLTLRGGESGLDILTWLRTQRERLHTPVCILTGHTVLSDDVEATIRRERAYVFYKGRRMAEIVDHLGVILRNDPQSK